MINYKPNAFKTPINVHQVNGVFYMQRQSLKCHADNATVEAKARTHDTNIIPDNDT